MQYRGYQGHESTLFNCPGAAAMLVEIASASRS